MFERFNYNEPPSEPTPEQEAAEHNLTVAEELRSLHPEIISYPPTVTYRETAGGRIQNKSLSERIEHSYAMATNPEYQHEKLSENDGLITTIDNKWLIAIPAASYDAYHLTIFRKAESTSGESLPLQRFRQLSPSEQSEYLHLAQLFTEQLSEKYPTEKFAFTTNQGTPPSTERGISNQSIPVIHGHVFAVGRSEEVSSFAQHYTPKAVGGSPEGAVNQKLIGLATTSEHHQNLANLSTQLTAHPHSMVDKYIDFPLPEPQHWNAPENIKLLNDCLEQADQMANQIISRQLNKPTSYSWAIHQNTLRLGFPGGSTEMFNIALDRTLTTAPPEFEARAADFKHTASKIASQIEKS